MWSGLLADLPDNWILSDGNNGTVDLSDTFIKGRPLGGNIGDTGGEKQITLTVPQMPNHSHSLFVPGGSNHAHTQPWDESDVRGETGTPSTSRGATSPTGSFAAQPQMSLESGGGSISAEGGSPHENQPAFYDLAFVVKVN